jgi:hypothetical protein
MEVILCVVDGAGVSVSVTGTAVGVSVAFGVRMPPKLQAIMNTPTQIVIVHKFFRDMTLLLGVRFDSNRAELYARRVLSARIQNNFCVIVA